MKEWMLIALAFLLIFIIVLLFSGFIRSRFIQKKISPKTQLIISSGLYIILISFFIIDALNLHFRTLSLIGFAIIIIIYPILLYKRYKRLYTDKATFIN